MKDITSSSAWEYNGVEVEYTDGTILSAVCLYRLDRLHRYKRDILILPESDEETAEKSEWYAMAPIDVLTNNYSRKNLQHCEHGEF